MTGTLTIGILKIAAATLVFALFLLLIDYARGKAVMAGGLLLTFPAVNGITLLFAGYPSAAVMSDAPDDRVQRAYVSLLHTGVLFVSRLGALASSSGNRPMEFGNIICQHLAICSFAEDPNP